MADIVPTPASHHDEAVQRHTPEVEVVGRRVAGVLVLVVGLSGLGFETFRYRHLNDLTAIAFAIGAALLALGVIAVIAVPLLVLSPRLNGALIRWFGWVPGFGLILTGITHFTDWKFFHDTARWLTVHHRPTMRAIYAEGSVLILLGVLLVAAALLASHAYRSMHSPQA